MVNKYLALDVGEKRIGVALADSQVRIAIPIDTLSVDGTEKEEILRLIKFYNITKLIVGYPRNQSGEPTLQTDFVINFVNSLDLNPEAIEYQDESLTSVLAEKRLKEQGGDYQKGDIDKVAASIILQDYLERIR